MFDTICKAAGYVEFPNLFGGFRLSVDKTAFTLFGIQVQWYGVIIGLGVLLCMGLALRACKRYGIESNDLMDYFLFSFPAAIIGARAYYVIFNFDLYKDDLMEIFSYRSGGLAIYGGILAATLTVYCVSKVKKRYTFLQMIDFAVPYIFLGQAIGRWGNFFNQEAYGGPTDLPWGMTGSGISGVVHPTFLYESLWCFIGFTVILWYRRSRFKKTHGESVCLYMILYGFERSIVEGLRTDSLYIGHTGIRVSQLLSVVLLIIGVVMFVMLRYRYRRNLAVQEDAHDSSSGFEDTLTRLDQKEMHSTQDGE